jgi:hypothetical protein
MRNAQSEEVHSSMLLWGKCIYEIAVVYYSSRRMNAIRCRSQLPALDFLALLCSPM